MELKVVCALFIVINSVDARIGLKNSNSVFDTQLYEQVLDPELCDQQLGYLTTDTLLGLRFIDAGVRLPRGILTGNLVDLGNYHQCLGIDEVREELEIKGKYCMIRVPFNQTIALPEMETAQWLDLNSKSFEEISRIHGEYGTLQKTIVLNGDVSERSFLPENPLSAAIFRVAVCIPRPCSVEQAMTSLTSLGFEFEEDFCRLPNDKPWSTADYVAVVLFSAIGLLTILSTCYDLNHTFLQKRDPKQASALYRSFSLYTNGRRLTSFSSDPNSLHCLDGIRTLAMMWVIIGHTFGTENFVYNILEGMQFMLSPQALWLTMTPFTVDTFFMVTGVLLVYTTVGKLTGPKLLKNLHLFYLSRLLRLFPLLALTVLLQASLLNIMFDGPFWSTEAENVQRCREHWWATLLHIQNYATPNTTCVAHSWYIAIDVQLHIISPLVLFWVLGRSRRTAWIALTAALTLLFATTTYYNTYKNFPGYQFMANRPPSMVDFMNNYYVNTLTRAAPYFVGMVFGYILSICKGQKPKIHIAIVLLLWACCFTIFGLIVYFVYSVKDPTYDNRILDVIMNTYSRSAWAVAIGWIIFACVHGYAGPINWFLSLDMWKLPSRLSYAMYLLHYPFQFAINSTALTPVYFSVPAFIFKFLAYATFTFIISFIACVVIDAPCSTLVKLALGDGAKKQKPPATNADNGVRTKGVHVENNEDNTGIIKTNRTKDS